MKIYQPPYTTTIILLSILAFSCSESDTGQSNISNVDIVGNAVERVAPSNVDINTDNYINGLNDFSFNYFTNKTVEGERKNFVFSPLSISTALSLVVAFRRLRRLHPGPRF